MPAGAAGRESGARRASPFRLKTPRGLRLSDANLATLSTADLPFEDFDLRPRSRRREGIGRLALFAADATALAVAMEIVSALGGARLTLWAFVLLPFYWLLAKTAGLYDRDQFVLQKTTLDEAPALLAVAAIFALAIEGVQALAFTGRSQPLLLCGALTAALIAARALVRFAVGRALRPERVLVIGDAPTTAVVARTLAAYPRINAVVVGHVAGRVPAVTRAERSLGTVDELPGVIEAYEVERLIVAPVNEGGEDVIDAIRLGTACGVRVSVLPRLLEVIGTSVEFDQLGGHPLLGVRGFGLSSSSRMLKRLLDVLVASVALVALAPFLLIFALAVRLSSPGPVLYRQARVGRNGKEFHVLKFRTMVQDADELKEQLLERNEAEPLFKIADDPRTTRVGRFLRRRSLDELPQLFNVLRGDMSTVGPRPFVAEEDRLFSGWQRRRYHVAPGMTGPWQILGSSRVPVSEMVTLDYLYCANWSLWLDIKILARTVPYIFSRRSPEHPVGPQ